jgi:serine/threonine protein kinase
MSTISPTLIWTGRSVPRHYGNYIWNAPDREYEQDKQVNVVMTEFVRGSKLTTVLAGLSDASEGEISIMTTKLYKSLDAIHDLGIIHRHVSPRKCLVRKRSKQPVWIDFRFSGSFDKADEEFVLQLKDQDITKVTDMMEEVYARKDGLTLE